MCTPSCGNTPQGGHPELPGMTALRFKQLLAYWLYGP